MALADLLWACPACGTEAGVERQKGPAACAACGASYRRGSGASIEQTLPDGRSLSRPAAEWLDELEAGRNSRASAPPPARATLTEGRPPMPVRLGDRLLGWAERFGPTLQGRARLDEDALVFTADDGTATRLSFDEITAVQPASSTLQLKLRGRPVFSLRLLEGSVYAWEVSVQEAVRRRYRATGRGEIAEFLPRIVCR